MSTIPRGILASPNCGFGTATPAALSSFLKCARPPPCCARHRRLFGSAATLRGNPQSFVYKAVAVPGNSPTRRRRDVVIGCPENQVRVFDPSCAQVAFGRLTRAAWMRVIESDDFVASLAAGANGGEQRRPIQLVRSSWVAGCDVPPLDGMIHVYPSSDSPTDQDTATLLGVIAASYPQ